MPVFHVHVPAGRFFPAQKRAIADALNQSLVDSLGIPAEDRFIMITEHGEAELHLHPTFMGMNRDPENAMLIDVLVGAHRPLEDKHAVVAAVNKMVVDAVDVSPDDVFIVLTPVPIENFSFGRGVLHMAESGPRW